MARAGGRLDAAQQGIGGDAVRVGAGQARADDLPPGVGQVGRQTQFVGAAGVGHRRVPAGRRGGAGQREGVGEHEVGEDAEGPHVGGRADAAAAFADLGPQQFRRGVVGRGEGRGVGVGALQLGCHVEVGEADRVVLHQQHVGRFQVAVHPAGAVQLGQPLADLREQRGPCGGAGRGGEQRGQGALRPLQDEDGGAVQLRAVRVVYRQRLVHPHQPRMPQPPVQLDLPLDQLAQMVQPAGRRRAGGQELQGRRPGQLRLARARTGAALSPPGGVTGAPGGVHTAEGAGRDGLAHLPDADPVALRHGHGVGLGHRVTRPGGAARTARSSSRTRSKRSARETRDSFLPLSRGPGSALSGPGFRRSLTAR